MTDEKISRRSFLKLGAAGMWATALLLFSGCLGGGEEEEDDEGGGEDD